MVLRPMDEAEAKFVPEGNGFFSIFKALMYVMYVALLLPVWAILTIGLMVIGWLLQPIPQPVFSSDVSPLMRGLLQFSMLFGAASLLAGLSLLVVGGTIFLVLMVLFRASER